VREETAKVKKLIITADLIIPFEDVRLENFEKYVLQSHLNKLPEPIPRTESCKFDLMCERSSPRQPIRATSIRTLRVRSRYG
jgi:hypothetical protein